MIKIIILDKGEFNIMKYRKLVEHKKINGILAIMKIKRVILPTITMVIIASQLFGCASTTKQEAYDMMRETEQIELEYAVPDYDSNTEESKVELLPWLQLSSLETHPELRSAFEEYVGVTGTTGNKEGILYTNPLTTQADQNITLLLAIKNSQFRGYVTMPDALEKLGEIAAENYTDIEADDVNAPYATINAYFELLPDQEDGQFDGDATISRAQAMALLMRATTPVNDQQAPEADKDFTSKVGESQYTNFAAPMNEYSYINTDNGLTEQSFNGTMTKGEFIALVTNYIRADYVATLKESGYTDLYSDTSDITISTVSDAGDIKYSEAISDASKGVPTDLYETFKLAIKNGYLAEADLEDWDSALTKADAVSLFITMTTNYTSELGSTLYSQYQAPATDTSTSSEYNDDENEIRNSEWADINGAWDAVHQYTLYAKSQGADGTGGWCWIYFNGKGAGDQPSYAVYMKEGDPLYGTVYHVGDYLPSGEQFSGTNDEWEAFIKQDFERLLTEDGSVSFKDPETGRTIIGTQEEIDAYKASKGYN